MVHKILRKLIHLASIGLGVSFSKKSCLKCRTLISTNEGLSIEPPQTQL